MSGRMAKRTEIRLAGEGGQGMILAGIILAEAAAIFDGKMAVQTQSYGPEARGGASKAEVVIADGEIDHPEVLSADVVVALSQEAFDKYAEFCQAGRAADRGRRQRAFHPQAGGDQDPDQLAGDAYHREEHRDQHSRAGDIGGVDRGGEPPGDRAGRQQRVRRAGRRR